jgi:hypothetical protein
MEEDLPLRVAQKQGQQAPLQAISRPHLHEGGGGGKNIAKPLLLNIGPNVGSRNKWPVNLGSTWSMQN